MESVDGNAANSQSNRSIAKNSFEASLKELALLKSFSDDIVPAKKMISEANIHLDDKPGSNFSMDLLNRACNIIKPAFEVEKGSKIEADPQEWISANPSKSDIAFKYLIVANKKENIESSNINDDVFQLKDDKYGSASEKRWIVKFRSHLKIAELLNYSDENKSDNEPAEIPDIVKGYMTELGVDPSKYDMKTAALFFYKIASEEYAKYTPTNITGSNIYLIQEGAQASKSLGEGIYLMFLKGKDLDKLQTIIGKRDALEYSKEVLTKSKEIFRIYFKNIDEMVKTGVKDSKNVPIKLEQYAINAYADLNADFGDIELTRITKPLNSREEVLAALVVIENAEKEFKKSFITTQDGTEGGKSLNLISVVKIETEDTANPNAVTSANLLGNTTFVSGSEKMSKLHASETWNKFRTMKLQLLKSLTPDYPEADIKIEINKKDSSYNHSLDKGSKNFAKTIEVNGRFYVVDNSYQVPTVTSGGSVAINPDKYVVQKGDVSIWNVAKKLIIQRKESEGIEGYMPKNAEINALKNDIAKLNPEIMNRKEKSGWIYVNNELNIPVANNESLAESSTTVDVEKLAKDAIGITETEDEAKIVIEQHNKFNNSPLLASLGNFAVLTDDETKTAKVEKKEDIYFGVSESKIKEMNSLITRKYIDSLNNLAMMTEEELKAEEVRVLALIDLDQSVHGMEYPSSYDVLLDYVSLSIDKIGKKEKVTDDEIDSLIEYCNKTIRYSEDRDFVYVYPIPGKDNSDITEKKLQSHKKALTFYVWNRANSLLADLQLIKGDYDQSRAISKGVFLSKMVNDNVQEIDNNKIAIYKSTALLNDIEMSLLIKDEMPAEDDVQIARALIEQIDEGVQKDTLMVRADQLSSSIAFIDGDYDKALKMLEGIDCLSKGLMSGYMRYAQAYLLAAEIYSSQDIDEKSLAEKNESLKYGEKLRKNLEPLLNDPNYAMQAAVAIIKSFVHEEEFAKASEFGTKALKHPLNNKFRLRVGFETAMAEAFGKMYYEAKQHIMAVVGDPLAELDNLLTDSRVLSNQIIGIESKLGLADIIAWSSKEDPFTFIKDTTFYADDFKGKSAIALESALIGKCGISGAVDTSKIASNIIEEYKVYLKNIFSNNLEDKYLIFNPYMTSDKIKAILPDNAPVELFNLLKQSLNAPALNDEEAIFVLNKLVTNTSLFKRFISENNLISVPEDVMYFPKTDFSETEFSKLDEHEQVCVSKINRGLIKAMAPLEYPFEPEKPETAYPSAKVLFEDVIAKLNSWQKMETGTMKEKSLYKNNRSYLNLLYIQAYVEYGKTMLIAAKISQKEKDYDNAVLALEEAGKVVEKWGDSIDKKKIKYSINLVKIKILKAKIETLGSVESILKVRQIIDDIEADNAQSNLSANAKQKLMKIVNN